MGQDEIWDCPSSQQEVLKVTIKNCVFLGYFMPHVQGSPGASFSSRFQERGWVPNKAAS